MTKRIEAANTRTHWDKRHHYEKEYKNADEAEWAAYLRGSAHISQGTHDELMSEAALENSDTPGPLFMMREAADESLQGAVLEIIDERTKLLGEAGYPFVLEDNSLVFNGQAGHPYIALLALCNMVSLSAKPYNQAPVGFEYLSLLAAKAYLGANAKGWRFGWPRKNSAVLLIRDATRMLQKRSGGHIGEWEWNPDPNYNENPSSKSLKDAGMDFIAWIPWSDKGPAQLHLVGQCACGEDWKLKTHDLTLSSLGRWMRLPHPPPVRALFTPRHTPLPTISHKATEAGLIFDRIRMVQLLLANDRTCRAAAPFVKSILNVAVA